MGRKCNTSDIRSIKPAGRDKFYFFNITVNMEFDKSQEIYTKYHKSINTNSQNYAITDKNIKYLQLMLGKQTI